MVGKVRPHFAAPPFLQELPHAAARSRRAQLRRDAQLGAVGQRRASDRTSHENRAPFFGPGSWVGNQLRFSGKKSDQETGDLAGQNLTGGSPGKVNHIF